MAYPIEYANDVLIEQLRDFRVLVTGGAGFIGSHLAKRLVAEGIDTTVLDNLSSGNLNNLTDIEGKNNFHFVKGDVRDSDIVKIATKDTNVIFHEAALVSIPQSIKDPLLANDINLVGTLNLLQAAVERGVKRFIFASSAAVYGESPEAQKKEETVTSPSNPYGVSKAAAESYLRIFNELYGIETVSLRYFNVYGPGQAFANTYTGVITVFANRLLENKPLMIFGDGLQTRDFVYIQDIVQANIKAMTCKNVAGRCFNIGTGVGTSVNTLAEILKTLLNKKEENQHLKPRQGDVKHNYADITLARKTLGYNPDFSLEEGLSGFVNWRKTKHPLSASNCL